MAGINENAVYIQYGGKGDMQEMKSVSMQSTFGSTNRETRAR